MPISTCRQAPSSPFRAALAERLGRAAGEQSRERRLPARRRRARSRGAVGGTSAGPRGIRSTTSYFVRLPDGLPARARCSARFGASEGGSPGFRVQTSSRKPSPLSVRLALPDAGEWMELARPTVRVVGAHAHVLVLTAPSRASAGRAFELHVRVEDRWGNPAILDAPVYLEAPLDRRITLPPGGWQRVEVQLERTGVHRLTARTEGALGCRATSTRSRS
jgi:hypothetical protein